MSGEVGEYLDGKGLEFNRPSDDALDPSTVATIEELHTAVLRAEAGRRFGGRNSHEIDEARSAEHAFLQERGFATYNDYRLRIRRSTVATSTTAVEGAVNPSEAAVSDSASLAAPSDQGVVAEAPEPEMAVASPDQPVTAGATNPSQQPAPLQAGPFIASLKRELDGYLAEQNALVEDRAAEILGAASRHAGEMLAQARRSLDQMDTFMAEATALASRMAAATESMLPVVAEVHASVSAVRAALRNVAVGASALVEPPTDEAAGPRSFPPSP